jgi:hypothetical protein
LELPGRNLNATSLFQMTFGFHKSRFVGSLQTDELGQGGRITAFQAQRGIGWIVTGLLAHVIIVIPFQDEMTKDALHLKFFPALADFQFGLVGGVNPIGRLLEEPRQQIVGGFEDGSGHQHFHCATTAPVGVWDWNWPTRPFAILNKPFLSG